MFCDEILLGFDKVSLLFLVLIFFFFNVHSLNLGGNLFL